MEPHTTFSFTLQAATILRLLLQMLIAFVQFQKQWENDSKACPHNLQPSSPPGNSTTPPQVPPSGYEATTKPLFFLGVSNADIVGIWDHQYGNKNNTLRWRSPRVQTNAGSKDKLRERERHTNKLNFIIQKMNPFSTRLQESIYILTNLGQLPFSLFTEIV